MTRLAKMVLVSCSLALLYVISVVLGEMKTVSLMNGNSSAWHEALGYLLLAGLGAHVFLYWNQIKLALTKSKPQGFLILNILLLGMVLLTVMSGIMISPQLGAGQMESHWRHFHHVAPKLTLLLVLVHIVLRWKKISVALKPSQTRPEIKKLDK